jgi:hypothetical protein
MIERIDLHDDGVHCTVTGDGFEIVTTLPNVKALTRWERVYASKMNRVWGLERRLDPALHRARVDLLLREAAYRSPVSNNWVPTRDWVLGYCREHHQDRTGGIEDEAFFEGAALFEPGLGRGPAKYIVHRKFLKADAEACGFTGTDKAFGHALTAVCVLRRTPTTVAKRSVIPMEVRLTEAEIGALRTASRARA